MSSMSLVNSMQPAEELEDELEEYSWLIKKFQIKAIQIISTPGITVPKTTTAYEDMNSLQ